MDPNSNLNEQLKLAASIVKDEEADADATRLAELVISLHEWIINGGFLPERWQR